MYSKVLTISIAAYNIDKYIRNTLDSFIISDIIEDLEVIIVNDGSKDNTLEIAREYEHKYPDLFVVVDKANGGYGSTINAAYKIAKGKYFKTIDGDDWVDKNGIIKLVNYLKKCNDDIVVTNFCRVNDKNGKIKKTIFETSKYAKTMKFDEGYLGQELYMQGVTIKTELLKIARLNILEHCFYTDIEYILTPVPFYETISFLNVNVYMYRVALNEQSMSVNGKRKHIDEQIKVLRKMISYYDKYYDELSAGKRRYFEVILSGMIKSHFTAILSLKLSKDAYKRMINFDKEVHNKNIELYNLTNEYIVIKLLRKSKYKLYYGESIAYKFYQYLIKVLGK